MVFIICTSMDYYELHVFKFCSLHSQIKLFLQKSRKSTYIPVKPVLLKYCVIPGQCFNVCEYASD